MAVGLNITGVAYAQEIRPSTQAADVRGIKPVAPATTAAAPAAQGEAQLSAQDAVQKNLKLPTTEAPRVDETAWTVNAGGVLNTGNTRAVTLNIGTRALVVRGMNQASGDLQFSYGRASLPNTEQPGAFENWRTNANNINAQARYDRFLTLMDGLFVGGRFRRDPFAGLDLRLQGQVGYLREIFRELNHRFWTEIGYDITYDNFYPQPGSDVVHSVRGFVGYQNQLNPFVAFVSGLEGLYDVENSRNVRLQWISEINSKIEDRFQLSLMFAARFDNVPVENREKLDTLTTLNLVYSLL